MRMIATHEMVANHGVADGFGETSGLALVPGLVEEVVDGAPMFSRDSWEQLCGWGCS